MKRIIALMLGVIMLLSLAACGSDSKATEPTKAATEAATEAVTEAPTEAAKASTKMTMGTGGSAGTYYAYGTILGRYMKEKANVDVTVVSTDGSKANIQGIQVGDYSLGTVQSDVMSYGWEGTRSFEATGKVDSFRVIAGLYAEAVQLITMNPEIKSIADLKGKSVSIGAPSSGVYFNAVDVLSAAGLTVDDIKPQYQSFAESTDALKDGKIDAAFIVAGAPTPAISELCATNSAYLVPIDGDVAKAMMEASPFYTVYTIPAGTYNGQTEDVNTVTVKATLIVDANASEEDVYNITKAIFDNAADIAKEHGKGAELSLENATSGMTAPFHKGAAKYFAEQGVTVEAQ